jgi:hypothetical protein
MVDAKINHMPLPKGEVSNRAFGKVINFAGSRLVERASLLISVDEQYLKFLLRQSRDDIR